MLKRVLSILLAAVLAVSVCLSGSVVCALDDVREAEVLQAYIDFQYAELGKENESKDDFLSRVDMRARGAWVRWEFEGFCIVSIYATYDGGASQYGSRDDHYKLGDYVYYDSSRIHGGEYVYTDDGRLMTLEAAYASGVLTDEMLAWLSKQCGEVRLKPTLHADWTHLTKEQQAEIFDLYTALQFETLADLQFEYFRNMTLEEFRAGSPDFDMYVFVSAYPTENGYILNLTEALIEALPVYANVGAYVIDTMEYYHTMFLYADGALTPLEVTDLPDSVYDQMYAGDPRYYTIRKVGDTNADRAIDVSDILSLKNVIMNESGCYPGLLTLFDIDGSETIDVGDVLKLKSMILSA